MHLVARKLRDTNNIVASCMLPCCIQQCCMQQLHATKFYRVILFYRCVLFYWSRWSRKQVYLCAKHLYSKDIIETQTWLDIDGKKKTLLARLRKGASLNIFPISLLTSMVLLYNGAFTGISRARFLRERIHFTLDISKNSLTDHLKCIFLLVGLFGSQINLILLPLIVVTMHPHIQL